MYGCGEQEVGVASGSGWNLWVWLLGVVVRRYIDFLILLIPTPLVSVLFYSSIPTFCSLKKIQNVIIKQPIHHKYTTIWALLAPLQVHKNDTFVLVISRLHYAAIRRSKEHQSKPLMQWPTYETIT